MKTVPFHIKILNPDSLPVDLTTMKIQVKDLKGNWIDVDDKPEFRIVEK